LASSGAVNCVGPKVCVSPHNINTRPPRPLSHDRYGIHNRVCEKTTPILFEHPTMWIKRQICKAIGPIYACLKLSPVQIMWERVFVPTISTVRTVRVASCLHVLSSAVQQIQSIVRHTAQTSRSVHLYNLSYCKLTRSHPTFSKLRTMWVPLT